MEKLPSMSVTTPVALWPSGTTLAPISGSESVAEITVPCTVMFCAFATVAKVRSASAVRIVFFMSIMIGEYSAANLPLS